MREVSLYLVQTLAYVWARALAAGGHQTRVVALSVTPEHGILLGLLFTGLSAVNRLRRPSSFYPLTLFVTVFLP